jgi:hypothetical protein
VLTGSGNRSESVSFPECVGGLPAIKNPDGDQIHRIEPRAGTRETRPKRITRSPLQDKTRDRSEKPCKRSGQTDGGASFQRDFHGLPANISAKTGQKNGHVGGQSATTNVDVVAQFVNENQKGERKAELPVPESPVNSEKGAQTETVTSPLRGEGKSAFGALDDGVELGSGCFFDGSGERELCELHGQLGWVGREQLEA